MYDIQDAFVSKRAQLSIWNAFNITYVPYCSFRESAVASKPLFVWV